jgi:hypothetical protein
MLVENDKAQKVGSESTQQSGRYSREYLVLVLLAQEVHRRRTIRRPSNYCSLRDSRQIALFLHICNTS